MYCYLRHKWGLPFTSAASLVTVSSHNLTYRRGKWATSRRDNVSFMLFYGLRPSKGRFAKKARYAKEGTLYEFTRSKMSLN